MIILDSSSTSLEVILSGTPTTPFDWNCSYIDVTSTTYTPVSNDGTINSSVTAATLAGGPSSGQRNVKGFTICNVSIEAMTVIIQKNTSSVIKILCKAKIEPGDTLQYTDQEGFTIIAFNSGIKNSSIPDMALSAGTQSVASGIVVFSNSNNISFGMTGTNNNTSISGGSVLTITASSQRDQTASFFEVHKAEFNANSVYTNSTVANILNLSFQRFLIEYDMTATRLDFLVNLTAAASRNGAWTLNAGIYTRNSTTLTLASSIGSNTSWSSLGASNNSGSYNGISGTRWRTLAPSNWAFTPGEYWMAVLLSISGTVGTTASATMFGQSTWNILPQDGIAADTYGNLGLYSAATGAFPNNPSITDIIYGHTNTGASSGSFVLRQPYFRMFGSYS